MVNYLLLIAIALFLILWAINSFQASQTQARIINVHDGDTVKVNYRGKKISLRLCGIDANEIRQHGGIEARDYLRSLIPVGSRISILFNSSKSYNRHVAFIYRGNLDLNLQMVKSGYAVARVSYLPKALKATYKKAQAIAQKRKLGRWCNKKFQQDPTDFRNI